MKNFIKKHSTLLGIVGIIVILVGVGLFFLPQYLYQSGICAFCGLILFIIAVINHEVEVPTAQDAKGAKLTGGDIVRLAILAVAVAVLIVLCITRPECLMMLGVTLVLTILFLIAMSDDSGCGCFFVILIFIGLLLHYCS